MYYLYYRGYYPLYFYNPYLPIREFPPVDPEFFHQSANETKKLMEDASVILDKLADSKEFDEELMYAAQTSDIEEVERLINSIDISSEVEVHFNPDNLRLEFKSHVEETECCKLTVALRWR
ncbi:hypothetical protein CIL05_14570 [Virgibacillus profundi]|uniref:Uncharacterized protein n=1 Tax=Virgibacillus profundi TaxID=2024555 RepID=A0A2A2IB40_9BACI|nr:hypothetical protein [Virgibacillus profundi]PAV28847.1 hypothetical protein CIL05_14570 [Virgibacillus profundi]PXY53015.1 hypothetical protein CIT14_14695 [Virgibacillus profundi]